MGTLPKLDISILETLGSRPADSFEIFAGDPENPLWLETVVDIHRAMQRLQELSSYSPGEYFLFRVRQQQVILRIRTGAP